MIATLAIMAFLGLAFGSFVNALVWRFHERKNWVNARSQCPDCEHQLSGRDLIPVISWLALRGKCRYCGQPISWQYPIVEIAGALIFSGSYLFWPSSLDQTGNLILLATFLATSIGLLALIVYDFRWMLLPNKILYPTFFVAAAGQVAYLIGYEPQKLHFLLIWLASLAISSGIFLVLFVVSKGKWIGYGDVRLGLITGTLLHSPALSLLMIFLASILGTMFVGPSLLAKRRNLHERLPFGPFLIIATIICTLFGQSLLHWYTTQAGL